MLSLLLHRLFPRRTSSAHDRRRRVIAEVRQRLRRVRRRIGAPGPEALTLARQLRGQRAQLLALLDGVESCAGCARGNGCRVSGRHGARPLPASPWSGGRCCAGKTAQLVDDAELTVLAALGARPADLRPPPAATPAHEGCAFRGLDGCSLPAAYRPSICLGYLCGELATELEGQGLRTRVLLLVESLEEQGARLRKALRC